MKGLAISSSPFIRKAHRDLARCVLLRSRSRCNLCADCSPSDLRGALNAIATSTLIKAKKKNEAPAKPAVKRPPKATASAAKAKKKDDTDDEEEAYHFIGYVPAYGKVWELDGLKSGPLEVGELTDDPGENKTWMDVVRPALRMKMQKYGGAAGGSNIRFSLLALVDGHYEHASDALEFLKRERAALQRRMPPDWESRVRRFSVRCVAGTR